MTIFRLLCGLLVLSALWSCSGVRPALTTEPRYAPEALRNEYDLMRQLLEREHPSLYWYTPKDSMDLFFSRYRSRITDSMTEPEFAWRIMAPMLQHIRCGHTAVRMSSAYVSRNRDRIFPGFPFYLMNWGDSLMVTGTRYGKDTLLSRGTRILSVNQVASARICQEIGDHLPVDGYAGGINTLRLSGNFPSLHRNVFGVSPRYQLEYLDSGGRVRWMEVAAFVPDTARVKAPTPAPKAPRIPNHRFSRDSSGTYAVMTLRTFTGIDMYFFLKRSFRRLRRDPVPHLIVDLRNNGGGNIYLSTLLTRYLSRTSFRVADSAITRQNHLGRYTRYHQGKGWNNLHLRTLARKGADGQYHLRRYERHRFRPKRRNAFTGQVWVLTSGITFSASTLFAAAVKGQPGIQLVGEETGGGWYGNSGILIPDITLPETGIRFRMPLYRLVNYRHEKERKGYGIPPDWRIPADPEAVLRREDKKMKTLTTRLRQEKAGQP